MIHLVIPGLPPSSNNAYFHRGPIRTLTTKGKKYKNETVTFLQSNYRKEMMIFEKDSRYQLYFRFHCESIVNRATNAKSRYKKFDGGNMCKLLEDCLAAAGGIDDSQTMTSTWNKRQGMPEQTEIWAWNLEKEHDPFDIDFILGHLC